MLAGDPPFTGPTAQAIVAKVITEKPVPLARQRDSVPAHVDAAIAQALSKLAADRPSSAREFASALQNPTFTWVGQAAPVTSPTTSARPSLSGPGRAVLAGGAALAVFGIAAGVWAWRTSRPAEPRPLVALMLEVPTANAELHSKATSGRSPSGAGRRSRSCPVTRWWLDA
jgi:hypothetical protein